jgi:hypothetical protein
MQRGNTWHNDKVGRYCTTDSAFKQTWDFAMQHNQSSDWYRHQSYNQLYLSRVIQV